MQLSWLVPDQTPLLHGEWTWSYAGIIPGMIEPVSPTHPPCLVPISMPGAGRSRWLADFTSGLHLIQNSVTLSKGYDTCQPLLMQPHLALNPYRSGDAQLPVVLRPRQMEVTNLADIYPDTIPPRPGPGGALRGAVYLGWVTPAAVPVLSSA